MRSKGMLYFTGGVIALILLASTCATGYFVGHTVLPNNQSSGDTSSLLQVTPNEADLSTTASNPDDLKQLFNPFWQSWQIVHDQYVDQPVDDEALMQGAIRGMLESLGDPHTSYMDSFQFNQANIPLDGEYEGIGAWVDPTGQYLTIVSPMPGSPAEKVGLKPGDQIIAIDGQDMNGVDGELVIRQVLGPAGTTVKLTINREGLSEPFDVDVIRANIIVPSTDSKMLEGNIAYVHLLTFGDKSTSELRQALKDLLAQEPVGLIFDLRNNGGGALKTAIEVASEFVGDGVIMYEEYGNDTRDTYSAIKGGLATQVPLIVLINEGTASASEIVAGAIQDHGRGPLVGTTSFGKGSVQNWIPLKDDQGAIRVTIARWLTPDGRTIHEIGLQPDVVVELTDEDIQAGKDPQLDKAIELITQ